MFKWLFIYWKYNIDLVSTEFKINLWTFINTKFFKLKVSNILIYFVLNLNNLYVKSLKIFHKNYSFELIYIKCIYILLLLTVLCVFL